ncbi:eukaryotic translation initiation factor 5B-like [Impatiens glandulifera]|uniref:eukaryotic translation initiation factor 5B-like n=1 Tax=Impatiens glandulifera TaxID=253017 RepID=UPI001FB16D09|nr:eukaryotic translation initiation factor 5B-like [Impatiens glandulifera]XP_047332267.1 eukaryotic translation initiation factor 5B-like [Impatiens glandulifera]
MGRKKPGAREDDTVAPLTGGVKSKKKALLIDDDEYSVSTQMSEEQQQVPEENVIPTGGKKKGKKGKARNLEIDDDEFDEKALDVDEDDDATPVVLFAGKKKPKSKKGGNSNSLTVPGFGLLVEEDQDDDNEKDEDMDVEEDFVAAFTGKKKPSKSKKKSKAPSSFDALDDLDGSKDDEGNEEEDTNFSSITFSGKKKASKSSKKNVVSFSSAFVEEFNDDNIDDAGDEDTSAVTFSGKKKSTKKKSNSVFSTLEPELVDQSPNLIEQVAEDVVETSKSKRKKKKAERSAQEEDDLDKLLAELGEGPVIAKSSSVPVPTPLSEDKAQTQSEEVAPANIGAEEDGPMESAAAKKKKKKKEKEKEKKAAAAVSASIPAEAVKQEMPEETKVETKGKVTDKKVPKHVREMQERLARLKELEEKKKREEEEKLRKEEEEQKRLEELERIAEEKKRIKKEKEKEKILKKKQEGTFLTGKQKEEARRLEAMRNQILANVGGLQIPVADAGGAPSKRPIYKTKKSKPNNSQVNGSVQEKVVESIDEIEIQQDVEAELDSKELEKVEEESSEVAEVVEDNLKEEDEDEDEWDAKSWDDVDLKLPGSSAFADEEADSESEPVVVNAKMDAPSSSSSSTVQSVPKETLDMERKTSKAEVGDKNKRKGPSSDVSPSQEEADLRSPICCIMGHVDTGKTKLLDCIRGTNVQEGEAGGITQQIGATYFPAENIRERTKELKADAKLNVPGLLVIDTPGHESFTNLRSRGSGLCDIAILVVDIMHGLEPQTIESLNLLKMRNTEFIVALNKVDRLYGWKTCRNAPIVKAMKQQSKDVQLEFNMRLTQIVTQLKEQGLNTELYYKNKDMGETYCIVPTSAISGEGIPDLLLLLVQWTQKTMIEKLTYSSEIQCTVLEVKVVEGHGTTIDVVLVNGLLHEGDQIVVCGMQGPIVTTIRALLTPHPMKELRVKGTFLHHKEIKAAQGIKITAQGLEHAIAGTGLYVVGPNDDLEDIKESAMEDMKSVLSRIDKTGEGVCVQASTLGSLEALLEFLKSPAVSIPVSGISIGPVHKKDVVKASVMLEKKKEYATILAFDVKVTPDARELADELGVKIFIADIIYHLFDQFKAYIDNLKEEKKKEAAEDAVFPCVLKIMPNCVFNKKDPIVLGVDILEGIAKIGTPICIPQKDFIDIGRIASIENNHKPVDYAKKGQKVAIKITGSNSDEQQKMFGRHFEMEDELVSHISRRSIDVLKTNYRDDLSMEEWKLVVKLKNLFKIQ